MIKVFLSAVCVSILTLQFSYANAEEKKAESDDSTDLSSAKVSDVKVKVKGKLEGRAGKSVSDKDFLDKLKSTESLVNYDKKIYNYSGLAYDTSVTFDFQKEIAGLNTGVTIELNADSSQSSDQGHSRKAYAYIETPRGRFEMGSMDGPSSKLRVGATKLSRGTGGVDGVWKNWVPYKALSVIEANGVASEAHDISSAFIHKPALLATGDIQKKPNRLSFYPTIVSYDQVKFGVSFIPQLDSRGDMHQLSKKRKKASFVSVVELGGSYKVDIAPKADLTFALGAEFGKSSESKHYKSLRAFEVGALYNIDKMSFGLSYGDFGDSGTKLEYVGDKYAKYASVGASYQTGKFGASITHMTSNRAGAVDTSAADPATAKVYAGKNTAQVTSIAVDYAITDSIKQYIEFSHFSYSNKGDPNFVGNKGNVLLGGLKFEF